MLMLELLTESPYSPPSTLGPHRVADYLALPDEPRCELIYGRFYMAPAPRVRHQEVTALLYERLRAEVEQTGGRVIFAPVDVVLAEHSVLQPDVVYFSAERCHLVRDRIEGAPDLVIEVLSPETERRDRGPKLRLYAESGVREYWIVDPAVQSFESLVNAGGQFAVALAEDDVYASTVVTGLTVDLAAFWREVDRRAG
jgi:Uma2 family endonuclease